MLPSAPEIILWLLVMSMYSLLISDHIAEWDLIILKMVVSFFFFPKYEHVIKLIFFTGFISLVNVNYTQLFGQHIPRCRAP